MLKINPADTATLVAVVEPRSIESDLKFYWYNEHDLLGSSQSYTVPPSSSSIPNKLVVVDNEDNSKTILFTTVSNSAPILGKATIPTKGDTINATESTPILFQWTSYDSHDDKLTHVLQIDSTSYNVGSFTKVYQSGFQAGEHSFRVIVTDSYGVSDSLPWVKFMIVGSQEDAK